MKKQVLLFLFIIHILSFAITFVIFSPEKAADGEVYEMIPDEAIRLRILANSDNEHDQMVKHLVRDEVSDQVDNWVINISDIDEARELIQEQILEIEARAKGVLKEQNSKDTVKVEYGKNVTFPEKLYGKFLYPAGEYEAILITLGEGVGENWWCVLFPPLCFLDFGDNTEVADADTNDDNMESASEEIEEDEEEAVEVKFFLFEWLGLS